jgi:hypothetical protein
MMKHTSPESSFYALSRYVKKKVTQAIPPSDIGW